MDLLAPIKDHHSERHLFVGRVALSIVIGLLMCGAVVARLVQLQVVHHELFAEKSQGNRIRIEAMPPTRGLVFDRKGRILAENLPAYQLELIPEQVADLAANNVRPVCPDISLAIGAAIDGIGAKARWHELRCSHRSGI